jgi:hypothetical protein
VSKTAETSFTRTFDWDIEKTVTPANWDLFTGDSGTSEYTVTVTKGEGVDSDWAVDGVIKFVNNPPVGATIDYFSVVLSTAINGPFYCGVGFTIALAWGFRL